jgi:hypothetical protein
MYRDTLLGVESNDSHPTCSRYCFAQSRCHRSCRNSGRLVKEEATCKSIQGFATASEGLYSTKVEGGSPLVLFSLRQGNVRCVIW